MMNYTSPISTAELRDTVQYDYATGVFLWRKKTGSKSIVGKMVGSRKTNGYLDCSINKKKVYLHRMAWQYVWGIKSFPQIDHINGDRADNRLANMRAVPQHLNSANMKRRARNASGLKGVVKVGNRWAAYIHINYKTKYLGRYDTKELAHEAYLLAAKTAWGDHSRSE